MKLAVPAHTIAFVVGMTLSASAIADHDRNKRDRVVRESVEVSDHFVFNTSQVVDGATILIRDLRNQVINATIASRALEPDTAYSIWWAVFNHPRFCQEALRCSVSDLEVFGGDPRIKASVFWGGGFVSDGFGTGNTSLRLTRGRTTRELFAKSKNYGLRNFRGSEIHAVLRSHGAAGVAGTVAQQLGTASMACPAEGCQNVFSSVHIADR